MSLVHDSAQNADVGRAMQLVLEAESAGAARVADSRRSAELTVQAARAKAEAIRRRTDARIARLHTAYRAKVEAEVAVPPAQTAAAGTTGEAERLARMDQAVTRLALELTS